MAEQNDWAPEPWVQANNDDDSIIFDAERHKLAHQDAGYYAATHARIVACVNACAGVPTNILENTAFNIELKVLSSMFVPEKEAADGGQDTGPADGH